ncbi:MAG TPA: hypothetical protein EYQ11_02130 [Candidatus Poseidoniales archaeon]|jgi:hypothetical protein|nr:hypothetical protein [Candidatus Poseidoniales archaeon]HIL68113.1 hypothetical protein [Candidatus Poseidoniales archaeon]
MPGHLSALPSRLPLEIIHIRDAPEVDILVEISVKGEVQGKVPLGTMVVEPSVTTRESGAGTGVLAARVVEPSVTTRESGAGTEVLAARVVEPSVTTRESGAGTEVRINQEEDQKEKIGARTILDEEGIRVRVEGAGDVRLTPQHSSSALFCVFCGEECRDDLAGCHRS